MGDGACKKRKRKESDLPEEDEVLLLSEANDNFANSTV